MPAAGPVELAVETRYPWSGTVAVDVLSSTDAAWTLSLRIPAWARAAIVDGEPVAPGEYATLTRRWQAGDRVVLEIDVVPRLTAPNPRIDAVRGCVALERGPIVYCIEEHDLPAGVDLAAIAVDPAADPVDSGPVAQLDGLPGVALAGVARDLGGWRQSEYRDLREAAGGGAGGADAAAGRSLLRLGNRDGGGMRVWIPAAN